MTMMSQQDLAVCPKFYKLIATHIPPKVMLALPEATLRPPKVIIKVRGVPCLDRPV